MRTVPGPGAPHTCIPTVLLAAQGSVITKIRETHNVQIDMPRREASGDAARRLTVVGRQASAEAAAAEISAKASQRADHNSSPVRVCSWEDQVLSSFQCRDQVFQILHWKLCKPWSSRLQKPCWGRLMVGSVML